MIRARSAGRTFASDRIHDARPKCQARRTLMRPTLALIAALTALTCLPAVGTAQGRLEPDEGKASGISSPGEEAADDVDPEVLARCRRQAADQKLKGSARKAFMGTCVTPED
ncbi:PsiF family protein [Methylobacterium sp. E-066]|uniref:PsiF family protein n=1 Tax=Methylobacterium sp. E-066 TaxID=2836584 RepID=UPI00391A1BD4